jgi:hypothetical protein
MSSRSVISNSTGARPLRAVVDDELMFNITRAGGEFISAQKNEYPSYLKIDELAEAANELSQTRAFQQLTADLTAELRQQVSSFRIFDDRIEVGVCDAHGKISFQTLSSLNVSPELENACRKIMAIARGESSKDAPLKRAELPERPALDPTRLLPIYDRAGNITGYMASS